METVYNEIVNGEVVNSIVADASFIATQPGTWELRAEPQAPSIEDIARGWRDGELLNTDYIVPLTDHPDHAVTLAYRVALRNWPSTDSFPDTKPTL
tara:strand:- start:358 stop:645 length:288 start_codon:yes stop_codon:yes gene_type:complete